MKKHYLFTLANEDGEIVATRLEYIYLFQSPMILFKKLNRELNNKVWIKDFKRIK